MIRENARLLFLYALRSNASCEEALRPHEWNFRLARKGDIGAIRDCNLRTLPENYTPQVRCGWLGEFMSIGARICLFILLYCLYIFAVIQGGEKLFVLP